MMPSGLAWAMAGMTSRKMAALRSNLAAYPEITLIEGDTSFTLRNEEIIVASAKVAVRTIVANIFLPPYGKFIDDTIPVGSHSEVTRGTSDIEVRIAVRPNAAARKLERRTAEGRTD